MRVGTLVVTSGRKKWDAPWALLRPLAPRVMDLNATGDRSASEQSYRQALAIAKRQSAKTLELLAATSLARLWLDRGKRTDARDLLAPIYGWFTEGFDTPVLQDAKALLDQLA
jgi:predicted ATPase